MIFSRLIFTLLLEQALEIAMQINFTLIGVMLSSDLAANAQGVSVILSREVSATWRSMGERAIGPGQGILL